VPGTTQSTGEHRSQTEIEGCYGGTSLQYHKRHGVYLYPEFRRRLLMEIDLTEEEVVAIRERVAVLTIEHRDLDEVIARLSEDPVQDELQLTRLKRRKLLLKDHIAILERQLVPDVRA
jgi:hypothetical protein